jgi:ornithine cyclodeaminase
VFRRAARQSAERFGIRVDAVDSAAEAADAPCVLANTGRNGPVALEGGWLRDVAHLNTIGATAPWLREVDAATFTRARSVVVDTEHAASECGDVIAAHAVDASDDQRVTTLAQLVANPQRAVPAGGLSVFESVGTAVQDLAAARVVAQVARERGIGRELDIVNPKTF